MNKPHWTRRTKSGAYFDCEASDDSGQFIRGRPQFTELEATDECDRLTQLLIDAQCGREIAAPKEQLEKERARIAKLEADLAEEHIRRIETVSMCDQLQAELAQAKGEYAHEQQRRCENCTAWSVTGQCFRDPLAVPKQRSEWCRDGFKAKAKAKS